MGIIYLHPQVVFISVPGEIFPFFFFNLNGNLKDICQGWLRKQEGEVVPCRERVHKGPGSVSVSPPDDQELGTALK